jgi:hypothetical protein
MMIKNLTAPQGNSFNQAKKVKRVIKVAQNNNSLGSSNLLSAHLISSGEQINQRHSPLNAAGNNFSAKKVKKIHKKKVVS